MRVSSIEVDRFKGWFQAIDSVGMPRVVRIVSTICRWIHISGLPVAQRWHNVLDNFSIRRLVWRVEVFCALTGRDSSRAAGEHILKLTCPRVVPAHKNWDWQVQVTVSAD